MRNFQEREKILLDQIEKVRSFKMEALSGQLTELDWQLKQIEPCVDFTTNAIDKSSVVEVMSVRGPILNRLTEVGMYFIFLYFIFI